MKNTDRCAVACSAQTEKNAELSEHEDSRAALSTEQGSSCAAMCTGPESKKTEKITEQTNRLFTEQALREETVSSREAYSGSFLHVYHDEVSLPNGGDASREYIRHVGAVCIVALDGQGRIAMERQYRYPVGETVYEIPAGKLDSKQEDPTAAAQRELREETGITAGRMECLGSFYPTCAYSDEVIHIFLARDLSYGERSTDEDEFLSVEMVPLDEVKDMIMRGEIPDGKTQAAVLRVWLMCRGEN